MTESSQKHDNTKGWRGTWYRSRGYSGGASGAFRLKPPEVYHIDRNYHLELCELSETTEEGLLAIGRLKARETALPSFSLRWDEKYDHLNVDIHGVEPEQARSFKRGEKGYSGHTAERMEGGAFIIDIRTPTVYVFRGLISFGLSKELSYSMDVILVKEAKTSANHLDDSESDSCTPGHH